MRGSATEWESDARGVRNVQGKVLVRLEHGLEDRIALLSGQVLYSRREALEAFDVTFKKDTGAPVLAVATSNINHPVEVFSITDEKGTLVQLSNHGAFSQGGKFGTCAFISCSSTDGHVEIDSLYLTPAAYAGDGRCCSPKAATSDGCSDSRRT